jgi:hypothetical protein
MRGVLGSLINEVALPHDTLKNDSGSSVNKARSVIILYWHLNYFRVE